MYIKWNKINVKSTNEEIDKQLILLNSLSSEVQKWDLFFGINAEIENIKVIK